MWIEYNPNPYGRKTKDCAVRALAKILDVDWRTAFSLLSEVAKDTGYMADSASVLDNVLKAHGFKKESVPDVCAYCYTADDFSHEFFRGEYVLAFDGHVATVIGGNIYDAWDSSQEIPQYFWYREEQR